MKVKDLMIPVGDYKTISAQDSLGEAVALLSDSSHRDLMVVNADGNLEGVLTITDILIALEPNYKKLGKKDLDSDILSNRYVADLFKEFNLWSDTLEKLCKTGCTVKVADAMYVPATNEYLSEEDDLEQGIHRYIVGFHQPIIVRSNGDITGVLRLSDVFDEIKKRMLACACQ